MNCRHCGQPLKRRMLGGGWRECSCRKRQNRIERNSRLRLERGMVHGYDAAAERLGIPVAAVLELEDRRVLHRHWTADGLPVFAGADLDSLLAAGYGDPRYRQAGAELPKVCPTCQGHFVGPNDTIFCGEYCKLYHHNRHYYARNRESIIARVAANRKKKRGD